MSSGDVGVYAGALGGVIREEKLCGKGGGGTEYGGGGEVAR